MYCVHSLIVNKLLSLSAGVWFPLYSKLESRPSITNPLFQHLQDLPILPPHRHADAGEDTRIRYTASSSPLGGVTTIETAALITVTEFSPLRPSICRPADGARPTTASSFFSWRRGGKWGLIWSLPPFRLPCARLGISPHVLHQSICYAITTTVTITILPR